VKSLLDGDGIRFLFTSMVRNFTDFGVSASSWSRWSASAWPSRPD